LTPLPRRYALLGALVLAMAAPLAMAQAGAEGGPSWGSLNGQQRAALAPLEKDWGGIDANRKAKWLEIAARFPTMPADEQQRVQQRMGAWAAMTPAERGRARLSFQEAKQLDPQERQARWQAYQSLPAEQRQALVQRGNAASAPAAKRPANGTSAEPQAKRNLVAPPAAEKGSGRSVAPTLVQAAPGATTTLVTKPATPPVHQQPGMPKIAATPSFVDRNTLLPKRGPQGAERRTAAASASAQGASAPVATP
jgi:hypothetical protein